MQNEIRSKISVPDKKVMSTRKNYSSPTFYGQDVS